jgi:hypothetical protein
MSQGFSEEQKQQWKEKIIAQKNSGISIAAWCRQNNTVDHVFYYWRRKLFSDPIITRSSFAEIPFEKESGFSKIEYSGIRLEYQKVHIHLDKHFDSPTLKQCLSVLKEETC